MEGVIVALKGSAIVWALGGSFLLGVFSADQVWRSASRREKKAAAGMRHVTIIENTRRDDGARLLGDIEDALRMAEHAEMGAPR